MVRPTDEDIARLDVAIVWVAGQLVGQELEGDPARQPSVLYFVHHPHPADVEPPDHAIAPNVVPTARLTKSPDQRKASLCSCNATLLGA